MIERPCPTPPNKLNVLAELFEEAKRQDKYLMLDASHTPDLKWSLCCLSTLNPNHRFFGKSYLPPQIQRANKKPQVLISNDDGFFTGLALSSQRKKGKRRLTFKRHFVQAQSSTPKNTQIQMLRDAFSAQQMLSNPNNTFKQNHQDLNAMQ